MGRSLVFILPAVAYLLLIAAAISSAQQQPPGGAPAGPTPPPRVTDTPPPTPPTAEDKGGKTEPGGKPAGEGAAAAQQYDNLREGLKAVAEGSRAISGWALLIVGASIVAVVSTSYMRPLDLRIRLTYLLFIPGWVLLGVSTYYGDVVSRRYMAGALAARNEILQDTVSNISLDFASQLFYFQRGLMVFCAWLIMFLLWWIFGSGDTTNK